MEWHRGCASVLTAASIAHRHYTCLLPPARRLANGVFMQPGSAVVEVSMKVCWRVLGAQRLAPRRSSLPARVHGPSLTLATHPAQDFPRDWLAYYYPSVFRREKLISYWEAAAWSDESWLMAPAEEQGLRECGGWVGG